MQIVAQASQKKRLREIFSPSLPSRDTDTFALPPLSLSPTSPSLTYFSWPVLPESVSVVSCVKPSSFLSSDTTHSNTPLTHACTHAHVRVHMCFFASVYSLQSTV